MIHMALRCYLKGPWGHRSPVCHLKLFQLVNINQHISVTTINILFIINNNNIVTNIIVVILYSTVIL